MADHHAVSIANLDIMNDDEIFPYRINETLHDMIKKCPLKYYNSFLLTSSK